MGILSVLRAQTWQNFGYFVFPQALYFVKYSKIYHPLHYQHGDSVEWD